MKHVALTAEQKSALDALPAKRRKFVLAYMGDSAGNATDAARRAGYARPREEGHRLLTFADILAAIEAFRAPAEEEKIATVESLRMLWTAIMLDASFTLRDRLRASELLGKSLGAFIQRHELSGPGGAPLEGELPIRFVLVTQDVATQIACGALERDPDGKPSPPVECTACDGTGLSPQHHERALELAVATERRTEELRRAHFRS